MNAVLAICFFHFFSVVSAAAPKINIGRIAKGRSRMFFLEGRTCSDGTDYAFIVTRGERAEPNENGKFEKVMITFMGGGACFDYPSCMGTIPEAGYIKNIVDVLGEAGFNLGTIITASRFGLVKAVADDCQLGMAGLLPCSSPEFADYVSLLMPYCTGDLHLGTQTATYYEDESSKAGESVTIRHHGGLHVLDLLPAFVAATGKPNNVRDLIIAGGSAGGWGALIWGGSFMEAFERGAADGFRGKLRTNVLVDSAFQAPPDDASILVKIFRAVKWGPSATTWRDDLNPIQPADLVIVLKRQLQHYAGRLRMAFLACDDDETDDGYASYVFPLFGVDTERSRVARMWNFLGDIHQFDSTLGAAYGGSDSRVFSFVGDCTKHFLTHNGEYTVHRLAGNARAPDLSSWVNTFLTTGFPYKVSSAVVRVGGPSYHLHRVGDADALKTLKADKHADKYWCCVEDLDNPGNTFQKGNFILPPADSRGAFVLLCRAR